ncbi:hypothetical protein AALP_AA4G013000 [Arabis alpina]|uniref:Synergin gamma C-terminal domain-containing protein n=1 Tax=Arabis alpina TaxID=50452 RepID=A0A087H0F4_ARAAL|nr:hypothetical protein AALP_AA4G013000 [Arabis alpina]
MNGVDFFFLGDDDWGDFVDSSPRIDPNGSLSDPNRIDSEKNRGPVPLSVFGEEDEDESGASFHFSLDSFSRSVISNLYRDNNGHNLQTNGNDKDSLNLDRDVLNSTTIHDDAWEFKTISKTAYGVCKEQQDNTESASVVWSSATNGDDDPWGSDGWEFKVAEAGESNKESNAWGLGLTFETTDSLQSNFEKEPQKRANGLISFPSNANANYDGNSWALKQPSLETGNEKEEKEVHNKPKGLLPLSFFEDEKLGTSDTLVHEENLVSVSDFSMTEKTKAQCPTVSISDLISSLYSQVEEKNAINLSEKSDGYGFVSVGAATDSSLVNGEDDSWEFQGSAKTITDPSITEGGDEFDSTWEFQGPSLALTNSDVAEGVDEFIDDSWEFQGPTQPVRDSRSRKDDDCSWESKHCSVEKEVANRYSVPDGCGELHEKTVISIEYNDYQDVFHKLKTELYYIALNHLKTLKEACDLAADSDEVAEVQKLDSEIQDLQNWLNSDVLISEVNVLNLQPRSSGITELSKALQEPKFRVYSEDFLSERLLLAEKDWKSTVELLKHATLTLKILNLGSPEEQSKYTSTWFVIASACAQELRHAASIWKQVIENDVQEEILSKPQGKRYALSVGEIYGVVNILRASTRLYRPWILLAPTSPNVLAVLDECVKLWLSSGLEEALLNNFNRHQRHDRDYSADQLLESIKKIDEVDAFTLHTCITSATSPTCYISGLNTEIVPGIKTVEWNREQHYLMPLANLWANLISRDPPSLLGYHFPTVSYKKPTLPS